MNYKNLFIKHCIEKEALKFGQFNLKSGRVSPFFFNSGVFTDSKSVNLISDIFINVIEENKIDFKNIFGPAYKGIPLAVSLTHKIFEKNKMVVGFVFNRKDEKTHGEGGNLVGDFLPGNTIVVDDVITAGTAIKNSLSLIMQIENIKINDLLVILDRQEKGESNKSASAEIKEKYNINTHSIITIQDILKFIETSSNFQKYQSSVREYIEKYGA